MIIGGDFNCRNTAWKCSTTERNGMELLNCANAENFQICSSKYPSRGQEHLDLFITEGNIEIEGRKDELQTFPFPSDHDGVILKCKLSCRTVEAHQQFIIDWKSVD